MNNKIFSKIKAKYPLAALVILIVAALMGKPILEDETGTVPVTETTVTETTLPETATTESTVTETVITEAADADEADAPKAEATKPITNEAGTSATVTEAKSEQAAQPKEEQPVISDYTFRSEEQFISHYEKHGIEMGFASAEEYLAAANKVISSPDALHKLEAEDNDHVYYLEATNEFVVLSQDGYIRTYFLPGAGIDYFNRQ